VARITATQQLIDAAIIQNPPPAADLRGIVQLSRNVGLELFFGTEKTTQFAFLSWVVKAACSSKSCGPRHRASTNLTARRGCSIIHG
jgi:hypothetical protein